MLHSQDGFVRLPNEQLIITSPPRTSLSLQPLGSNASKEKFSVQSGTGQIYLTNQRIVYVPSQPTKDLQSFSAPLLHVHDTHVTAPFFGPNAWLALVQPVPGGGIPASLPAVQLKVTFKEGGAFDFHNQFERIKERMQQAVENTQASSRGARNLDLSSVHLDELPAYSGPQGGASGTAPASENRPRSPPAHRPGPGPETGSEPMEPPPDYEEVQQQSVAEALEERLRRDS
ncbi:ubiquinol-cytochrome c reductase complex 17 kd protein [Aspergillus heteromorphus CBS 117.55]|uniref:Ubiquinol-cytochrome c reductase complex 17 kd protein n=1 Tax=Aspergillus heteromorphus CBS 117.55 TaxID=1448321 RepID=A0A317WRQ0_9EURO|nr:ubiquinol-cytochrome c reductase complex 17 kd protein [Aspergillus heteromorphus CBS 117.55]PWY87598.1 ubiquinol-cytochrome c reductase complex 17 kd protein [Aspergillus heteromorphus CBS 117.55]